MDQPDDFPARVGRQLARRREDLDLTQDELAGRIGITTAAVSKTERGVSRISRGRRPDWERALRLPPGCISRAYRTGELTMEPSDDDSGSDDVARTTEERLSELEATVAELIEDRKRRRDSPQRDEEAG